MGDQQRTTTTAYPYSYGHPCHALCCSPFLGSASKTCRTGTGRLADIHIIGKYMLSFPMPCRIAIISLVFFGADSKRAGLDRKSQTLIFLHQILIWGIYVIAVCFVRLGGVGRPTAVNMAIDPVRIVNDRKVGGASSLESNSLVTWFSQILYAGQLLYPTAISTTKLSILAMYWRIFPTLSTKVGCIIIACLSGMWWIAVGLVSMFQCQPIAKAWNPDLPGHCIDDLAYFVDNHRP